MSEPLSNYEGMRALVAQLTAERDAKDAKLAQLQRDYAAFIDKSVDELSKANAEVNRLRAELAEATGYLGRLFLSYAPQCTLLPNLLGICTQIDNCMVQIKDLRELREAVENKATTWAASSHKWNGLGCASDIRAVLAKVST